mmetsp:Transcript_16776/g.54620  ORF Transcript_16776/g.54620 Transcript_16776/m.54620 type:complete len:206 (+) Transcript_16776:3065-3682(+)
MAWALSWVGPTRGPPLAGSASWHATACSRSCATRSCAAQTSTWPTTTCGRPCTWRRPRAGCRALSCSSIRAPTSTPRTASARRRCVRPSCSSTWTSPVCSPPAVARWGSTNPPLRPSCRRSCTRVTCRCSACYSRAAQTPTPVTCTAGLRCTWRAPLAGRRPCRRSSRPAQTSTPSTRLATRRCRTPCGPTTSTWPTRCATRAPN